MHLDALNPVFVKRARRFAFAGVLMTALHALIASLLIETIVPSASLANGVAFLVATVTSYLVNTTWSFSSPLHGRNLLRFCLVSSVGLFLAMGLSGAAQFYGMSYWYGIGFVVCVVPPVTFLLHNFWTYR